MTTIVQEKSVPTIKTQMEKRTQRAMVAKPTQMILTCVVILMMRILSQDLYAFVDVNLRLVEIKTGKEQI